MLKVNNSDWPYTRDFIHLCRDSRFVSTCRDSRYVRTMVLYAVLLGFVITVLGALCWGIN